jgi:hypothetical protein
MGIFFISMGGIANAAGLVLAQVVLIDGAQALGLSILQ